MSNRCRRCNKKLKDQDALFGWRCAEILGVPEEMSMVDYETFLKFTEGVKYADSLFKNSNLKFSDSQLKEIYSIVAKMFLWDGVDDNVAKDAKKKLYSVVEGVNGQKEGFKATLNEYWTKIVNKAKETLNVNKLANSTIDKAKSTLNSVIELATDKLGNLADGISVDLANKSILDDITNKGLELYDKVMTSEKIKNLIPDAKVIDANGKLIENSKNKRGVENYNFNKEIDMSNYNGFINGQGKGNVSKLRFGNNTMSKNGCGVIAVYNSLVAMNDREDICNVAAHFESDGQIFGGSWGTNIYAIGRYFKDRGYNVESVSGDDVFSDKIPHADSYILASWNSAEVTDGMHIVAMRNTGNESIEIFNENNRKTTSSDFESVSAYAKEDDVQPVLMLAISKKV